MITCETSCLRGRDDEEESEQDHQQPADRQPRHVFPLNSTSRPQAGAYLTALGWMLWTSEAAGLNSCHRRRHGVRVAAFLRLGTERTRLCNHGGLEKHTHTHTGRERRKKTSLFLTPTSPPHTQLAAYLTWLACPPTDQ